MFRVASAAWLVCIGVLASDSSEAQSPHTFQRQPADTVSEAEGHTSCASANQLDAKAESHQALLQRTVSRPVTRQTAVEQPVTRNLKERTVSHPATRQTAVKQPITGNLLGTTTNLSTAGADIHVQAGALGYKAKAKLYGHMLDILTELNDELGPGTSANLDQAGYEELAELKDPQQMEFFTRRLVSQMGLRVRDHYGLLGFVPFFDGEKMTQTFDAMKKEIAKVAVEGEGWATDEVSGASAPLSQDGYAQVSILANNREMAEFVRRVVSDLGLSVEDEGGLQGLSEWHSGDKMVQTFGVLQGELINASKTNTSWVVRSQPCPGTGHPSDHELDEILENSTNPDESPDSSKPPEDKSGKQEPDKAEATKKSEATTTKQKPDQRKANKGAKDKSHGSSTKVTTTTTTPTTTTTENKKTVPEKSDSKVDEGASEEPAILDTDEDQAEEKEEPEEKKKADPATDEKAEEQEEDKKEPDERKKADPATDEQLEEQEAETEEPEEKKKADPAIHEKVEEQEEEQKEPEEKKKADPATDEKVEEQEEQNEGPEENKKADPATDEKVEEEEEAQEENHGDMIMKGEQPVDATVQTTAGEVKSADAEVSKMMKKITRSLAAGDRRGVDGETGDGAEAEIANAEEQVEDSKTTAESKTIADYPAGRKMLAESKLRIAKRSETEKQTTEKGATGARTNSSSPQKQATAPAQSSSPKKQATAPAQNSSPKKQATAPAHSSSPKKQITAPAHSSSPKKQISGKRATVVQSPTSLKLKELLPQHLLALARQTFKTDGAVLGMIDNSVVVNVTHAGVPISLRMNKFDDATQRLGSEGTFNSYDLDTLGDVDNKSKKVLNMIDVGGNYGVVTIAAMKKYAEKLRVVVVEPIPTTFFFLKWNLAINGVPEIQQADWDVNKDTPGVLALNSGSSDQAGENLHFCSLPESSMNSKMCDCEEGEENCIIVPSTTVDDLAAMFGSQPISMVKMDCEGCEFKCLPALMKPHIAKRVRRLAGELHIPDKPLEALACHWDHGRLMTKCQFSKENPEDVECDVKLSCPK